MSHFVAQPPSNGISKILNHRSIHVAWARMVPGRTWRLFTRDWKLIPCKHIASPDSAAIIMQNL